MSYKEIYAANSCGPIGGTVYNTIVAITATNELESLWATATESVEQIMEPMVLTTTASFNISDLNSPVPYSIYSRQPWCADYLASNAPSFVTSFGQTSVNLSCPTTAPYAPILVLPPNLLNSINPAWATCSGDVRGVYDPRE